MSKYAKILERVFVTVPSLKGLGDYAYLKPGTEVKNIKLVNDMSGLTRYQFEARGDQTAHRWVSCFASTDLPMFTDRGRTARSNHANRNVGRPSTKRAVKRLGLRVTQEQRAWLEEQAGARRCSITDAVTTILVDSGMPA